MNSSSLSYSTGLFAALTTRVNKKIKACNDTMIHCKQAIKKLFDYFRVGGRVQNHTETDTSNTISQVIVLKKSIPVLPIDNYMVHENMEHSFSVEEKSIPVLIPVLPIDNYMVHENMEHSFSVEGNVVEN